MREHIPRVIEPGARMKEIVEIENVVGERGRRPHGCLLFETGLRKSRAGSSRAAWIKLRSWPRSGGLGLNLAHASWGCGCADCNLPGLHRFGNFALQLDDEQAVLEARTPHLHMVGKGELALEIPR